jgi:catechol 2,3-dioxygenase-like lactoylglutathione lyase family enzyme
VPYVNHVAVPVDDIDRAAAFYEDWFDARVVPSPTFPIPVAWVLLGRVQVHLVLRPDQACEAHHFGVTIESREQFEALYWRADREGIFEREAFQHHLYEATGGVMQLYVRDPSGNIVECDYPDVTDLDPEIVAVRRRWSDYNAESEWNGSGSPFTPKQVGPRAVSGDPPADR